ncbi:MAG TPA: ribosome biogenesis GTPase Der [Bryobacteraceae bacterium]|nr:ribosome biogenesis GTPase Der [Bryobacteraceae bacterium]
MPQLPSVVIVGRPNVGKSTLFNAITGQRRSIVGDEPGITRDRIYGQAEYRGRAFEVVDTGGIIPNDEQMIPAEILKQARVALDDASHIVFLIDGRTEITGTDRDLAKMLRKLGKPVSVAVNKIDSQRREDLTHEFHSLGFEHVFAVSAEHRLGLDDLLDHVTQEIPSVKEARSSAKGSRRSQRAAAEAQESAEAPEQQLAPIKVAIIGRPNVGKSTLLNALTGSERAIVSPVAGTTRDAVDEGVTKDGVEYVFVDTAGIRRKGKTKLMAEKLSVVMARRHLRMANVAVLVLDATEGMLALDATIAGYAHEEGRAVVLCVNKWDATKNPDKRQFVEEIRDDLKFLDYASIAFISAQKRSGTNALFPLIRKADDSASRRVSTGELNRFVETLQWEYDMKIYYLTQASVRPPTFVVFTDKAAHLHFSAERYLINRLRERFGFEGTPIVIKAKRR